jgi:hypothetical protein
MEKKLRTVSILLLFLTIVWLVFTAISMSGVGPEWGDEDFVRWVSDPDLIFTLNYINASLLTIFVILLYFYLFFYLKALNRKLALAALIFVPVYGGINLLCYSIQICLVPRLAFVAIEKQEGFLQVAELIQANPQSLAGLLNGIAYALLGVPSIVYGRMLLQRSKRYSGIFLLLNGVFCLIGLLGYLTNSAILAMGIMLGGILFLVSLGCMVTEFKIKIS